MSSQNQSWFVSTLGRKILMALTGLVLIIFLVGHLSGNLMLLSSDPEPFNRYAHLLIGLGWPLIAIEAGLVVLFLIHVISALQVSFRNRKARGQSYRVVGSAGGPSRKSVSSKTMIFSGVVLFFFTILHVYTFKYGPGVDEGYVMQSQGEQIRDLYRLVVETFQNPYYVIWYVAAMALLGMHLWHGFWSAFQSLGVHHPRLVPWIRLIGVLAAVILGVGFLGLPVYIFLRGGA